MVRNAKPDPKDNTAAAFLAVHDDKVAVPAAIRTAFRAMLKIDPTQWLYELQFCSLAKVGANKLGPYRTIFSAHIVEVQGKDRNPKRAWFADPKVAAKVRKQLAESLPG